jgi:hypothetical protein
MAYMCSIFEAIHTITVLPTKQLRDIQMRRIVFHATATRSTRLCFHR